MNSFKALFLIFFFSGQLLSSQEQCVPMNSANKRTFESVLRDIDTRTNVNRQVADIPLVIQLYNAIQYQSYESEKAADYLKDLLDCSELDINAVDQHKESLLYKAIYHRDVQMVCFLLERTDLKLNMHNKMLQTPLEYAQAVLRTSCNKGDRQSAIKIVQFLNAKLKPKGIEISNLDIKAQEDVQNKFRVEPNLSGATSDWKKIVIIRLLFSSGIFVLLAYFMCANFN